MVVLFPGTRDDGFAEHVVATAAREQVTDTEDENPPVLPTAIAYVAELPELTVTAVGACGVSVKSGPVTVTLTAPEVEVV